MAKRKDEGHNETEGVLAEIEKRINKEYAQAEKELTEKINDYMAKFEKKDALKRQAVINGQITEEEYKQWRVGQVMIGKRWEEMRDSIATDLTHTADIAKGIANGYMPEVYAINHDYGTFQIEKAGHIDTSYTLYDRNAARRALSDSNTLYKAPGRKTQMLINQGKQMAWDKKQVQSVMMQGLLQGESIGKIATRLAKTVGDSDRKAAIRNARTMTTGVQNTGRVDSYKRAESMGIKLEQEWLATLDNRTRHEHRLLDGQKVPVGEKFKVEGYEIEYPGDPSAEAFLVYNCRCTLVPALEGFEKDNSFRENADIDGMSYEEWKEAHESTYDPITKQDDTEAAMKRAYGAEYKSYQKSSEIDMMGKSQEEHITADGKSFDVKTYKIDEYDNIWSQTYSAEAQKMCSYLNKEINSGDYGELDRIVVLKKEDMPGISAYDHKNNCLYICEELINKDKYKAIVDESYFPAKNVGDVVKHELGGHKSHWDAVTRYYDNNSNRNISMEEAKTELEGELRKYVKEQLSYDPLYISKVISENAADAYDKTNNLNELIADGIVKGDATKDKELLRLIKEVISYDGNAK